jgi:hypothetical protein
VRAVPPRAASGEADGGSALTTPTPLDETALARLLDAVVAGADPLEVMPPVAGPPGWTSARRSAFLDFHRGRSLDPVTAVERTWVVDVAGTAVGAGRLERSARSCASAEAAADVMNDSFMSPDVMNESFMTSGPGGHPERAAASAGSRALEVKRRKGLLTGPRSR